MGKELVKWIDGYEGLYQITSTGRVISADRYDKYNRHIGGVLKHSFTPTGYHFVKLCKDGICKQFYIHQLVAKAFLPNPENKKCVDHIDNNKDNNDISNLRWVTHLENMNNIITRRRMKEESAKYISQEGAENPFSRKVSMFSLDGRFIKTFDSCGRASSETGINASAINRVCRGERKQTHGFMFKYASEAKMKIQKRPDKNIHSKPIIQLTNGGKEIAEYPSICEASRVTGFYAGNIGRAANGILKSYKGYKWQYK